jgi:hypothetical protein
MDKQPKHIWETWEILLLVALALFVGYQLGRSPNAYEFGYNLGSSVRRLFIK